MGGRICAKNENKSLLLFLSFAFLRILHKIGRTVETGNGERPERNCIEANSTQENQQVL